MNTYLLFFTGSICVIHVHNCHRKACQIEEYGVDQTSSCPSTKHWFNDSTNPSTPFCFIFRLASTNRPSSRSSSTTPKIVCSSLPSFPEIFSVLRCRGSQAFSLSWIWAWVCFVAILPSDVYIIELCSVIFKSWRQGSITLCGCFSRKPKCRSFWPSL